MFENDEIEKVIINIDFIFKIEKIKLIKQRLNTFDFKAFKDNLDIMLQ